MVGFFIFDLVSVGEIGVIMEGVIDCFMIFLELFWDSILYECVFFFRLLSCVLIEINFFLFWLGEEINKLC